MWTYTTDSMDFVTVSTGLILPYWMGLPIRYIQLTFGSVSKKIFSVALSSGLTSDTLNIPTGLVIVISIIFAKKHAIIQLGKS